MKFLPLAVLALVFGFSAAARGQDEGRWSESQFHRVHLRNGNFVDGKVIRLTDKEVILKLTPGELCLRMDLVERIELIKMKSYSEKNIDIQKPAARPAVDGTKAPPPSSTRPATVTKVKLSDSVQEAVQGLLEEFDRGDIEMKQTVLTKMLKLDASVPAYLVSILPRFSRDQVPMVLGNLTQTKDPQLVPALAAHLSSDDPGLRLNVVMSLGTLGDASAVPHLAGVLQEKDPSLRAAAVTSLSLLNTPAAFEPLVPMISDPDRETRTRAISSLNDLAGKNNLQKSFADAISGALARSSGDVRLDLIYAAGHGGQPALSTAIAPYLRDESAPVRKASANALAELSAKDAAIGIAAAVQTEKDEEVQVALARAVQKVGVLDAGGALIGWLESGSTSTKEAARQALATLAGENFGSDIGRWKAWWDKARPQ